MKFSSMILLSFMIATIASGQGDSPTLLQLAAVQGIKPLGNGSDSSFLYTFTRGGQRRDALVLTPGTSFQADSIHAGRHCVSLLAAMPFNLGDGAILTISLRNATQDRRVVQLALDPAHIRAHRAWLPVRFEIPADLGDFTMRIEVNAGSRGDSTGDWMGLAAGPDKSCLFAAQ